MYTAALWKMEVEELHLGYVRVRVRVRREFFKVNDPIELYIGLGLGFRVQPLPLSMYSGLFTLDLLREG